MARTRTLGLVVLLLVTAAYSAGKEKEKPQEWQPLLPEELALKDCPTNPGCPAMFLYREEIVDDVGSFKKEYYRIKIFTDEGKKYADVEIHFVKDLFRVDDIQARTVRPDGKIVNFDGELYEKVVAKSGGVKFLAKTFTLPDVETGSIIEYRFTQQNPALLSFFLSYLGSSPTAEWTVQDELFTRRAHFSFRPRAGAVSWSWFGLPKGVMPKQQQEAIELDVENVPALEVEEYMPPKSMVGSRVDFFYIFRQSKNADSRGTDWFWEEEGKDHAQEAETFIGKHKGIERAAQEIVGPSDSPETKLRKLYARAQQIRNLSFEREKTEKEEKREKRKQNNNVEDVLKHGYGYGWEINELFVALARAAGMEAFVVRDAPRNQRTFVPSVLNWYQLSGHVVEVRVGSKILYFDPATLYCPFSQLPWPETGVQGIRLEKDRGIRVTTPNPQSTDGVINRKASLRLDSEGSLQGSVEVNFVGQVALDRRLANRDEDAAGRRKALEDEVKDWLPSGAKVELKGASKWESSERSFDADFSVKVPDYATSTGKRLLLPPAVLQANNKKYPFQTSKRVHPVYFPYPYQVVDDITIQPPPGYAIESVPFARKETMPFGHYEVNYQNQTGALHLHRQLVMDGISFPLQYYAALRVFFAKARAGDEQQAVLKATQVSQPK